MKRLPARVFSLASIVVLIGITVTAQKPATKPEQTKPQSQTRPQGDEKTQQIGVLEVELPVTVKDRKGPVSGLTKEDFEVFEDGKRQTILKFDAPSKLPLNIAVLMDTSNSVKLKLPFEKDAAEDFVATVTRYRKKDQVLFATFDSDVELHQDFTDSQEPLIRAIRKVKANGYTKLYDGVYRVIEEKMASPQTSDARRVMVIISDGADTASERSLRDAIQIAQRYNVTVFGISTKNFSGIGAGAVENSDDKELRVLCEQTGGQVFMPSQKLELFSSFTRIEKDLRQEYIIYYQPTNQGRSSKSREIKVKLTRRDADLSYKRGYVHD
jgi:Ca-activated chloride channel family protein